MIVLFSLQLVQSEFKKTDLEKITRSSAQAQYSAVLTTVEVLHVFSTFHVFYKAIITVVLFIPDFTSVLQFDLSFLEKHTLILNYREKCMD